MENTKYYINSCFAGVFYVLFSVCRLQNPAQQLRAREGCLRIWGNSWESPDSSQWSGWEWHWFILLVTGPVVHSLCGWTFHLLLQLAGVLWAQWLVLVLVCRPWLLLCSPFPAFGRGQMWLEVTSPCDTSIPKTALVLPHQGLWIWHVGLECHSWAGAATSSRGSRKILGRTVALLEGPVARQLRKRTGNAIFPFLLHFCYPLELKISFGEGGGLLNISCSVWREKTNCRCSGFQFQQIFSPAFSKPCAVHCWIQTQSVVHHCPAYCLMSSSGKDRNIRPLLRSWYCLFLSCKALVLWRWDGDADLIPTLCRDLWQRGSLN